VDSAFLMQVTRKAFVLLAEVGAPILLSSLAVGVGVALLQSITQVQDPTLTFIPKALVVAWVFWSSLPTIGLKFVEFTHECFGFVV
jgi:flagellar biosynthetic protein FliQ